MRYFQTYFFSSLNRNLIFTFCTSATSATTKGVDQGCLWSSLISAAEPYHIVKRKGISGVSHLCHVTYDQLQKSVQITTTHEFMSTLLSLHNFLKIFVGSIYSKLLYLHHSNVAVHFDRIIKALLLFLSINQENM